MKKMLTVSLILSALCGCTSWNYEGPVEQPKPADSVTAMPNDPLPASGVRWKGDGPIEKAVNH